MTKFESDCNTFFSVLQLKNRYLFNFFRVQYLAGLRAEEIINTNYATLNEDLSINWFTCKGNDARYFAPDYFDPAFYVFLQQDNNYFNKQSLKTIIYQFNLFYPTPHIFHKSKLIRTHIFRHMKMKKLYEYGYSIHQIGIVFGELEPRNVENYVFSELIY